MVFDQIEKLKQEFTDKYVVVDGQRPELRRFQAMTGVVRTVNMNGRALVEFDGLENIGWYDIDIDFLKVVDKPPEEEKKPAAKAKPKAAAKPAAKATAKPASKPAAGGGMSVDDILAAARGGSAAKESNPAEAKPAAKPAAAMSVEDILAAARGESGGAAKAEPEPATPEPAEPEPEVAEPEAAESEPEETPSAPAGDLPTDVEGIVAYCRNCDG